MAQTRAPLLDASDNRTVQLDGARLTSLRRARALTREQLAAFADGAHRLSEATIKRAEGGARVYLETARRLAEILEVPVDSLLVAGEPAGAHKPQVATNDTAPTSTAVAVLPFHALDDDARTCGLADGLAEDLTTRLADWWFPVICRGSTSRYLAETSETELANDLRAAYIVKGSVQQRAGWVRVHARLLDARSGIVLWTQEYNRGFSKLFELQDELSGHILDAVHHRLLLLADRKLAHRRDTDLNAWEIAARASRLFYDGTRESNERARALLRRAVHIDPTLGYGRYLLALTHQRDLINQWTQTPQDSLWQLSNLSVELQRVHPKDGRSEVIAAYVHVYEGQRERAIERLQRTVEANPSLSVAYSLLGQAMAMRGDVQPAFEQLEIAMRLSPRDSDLWTVQTATALAHFAAEDYAHAVDWAASAVRLRSDNPFTYAVLAAAQARLGSTADAKVSLAALRRLQPDITVHTYDLVLMSTQPDIAARYLDALRLAGL